MNSLEKKSPDATNLIHINQYNTDKEKIRDANKTIPDTSGLLTTTVLNTKTTEVENKIPNTSNAMTANALSAKISEVEN